VYLRRVKNFVKYAGLGHSARMVAVSEHVRKQAVAAGYPAARVCSILNGIDMERATVAARSKAQVACELAIPPGHHLLLMVGWDPSRKGVDLALAAVGSLVVQGFPLVLGILGMEQLSDYLSERKVTAACPWVRKIDATDDVASLYQAATIFLSPSRSEGFTYAACEAMANGTPVVLADIPPVAWARACPAAVFCQVGEANALRNAIRSVLEWSNAERDDRTRRSNQYVREKFAVRQWAEQVAEFYWGPPDPSTTIAVQASRLDPELDSAANLPTTGNRS
jgi:glycosyltransferase involved in cell wall biosynthesis